MRSSTCSRKKRSQVIAPAASSNRQRVSASSPSIKSSVPFTIDSQADNQSQLSATLPLSSVYVICLWMSIISLSSNKNSSALGAATDESTVSHSRTVSSLMLLHVSVLRQTEKEDDRQSEIDSNVEPIASSTETSSDGIVGDVKSKVKNSISLSITFYRFFIA